MRVILVCLTFGAAANAHAETRSNVTLGLDVGVATITDSYLAGITDTIMPEYRGHVGYEHWTGVQLEMMVSYVSWDHGAPYCHVCDKETVFSVLGGIRYTLPVWLVRPWVEAAIGVGHNWTTAPHSLLGGGIDVVLSLDGQSIALGIRADKNWFPYTHDRDGGPTDDDWVFLGAGLTIHLD